MTRTNFIRISTVAAALALVFAAPDVWANDDGDEKPALKSGKSVRRKLLYRSTRFEMAPQIAVTTGDTYVRNGVVGLNLSYYLTNAVGLGLTGGFSPLHLETQLGRNIKDTLAEKNQAQLQDLTYSYLQFFAGFEIKYVPIFGKFSFLNNSSVSYDLHLVAGATIFRHVACSASDPDTACAYTDEEPTDDTLTGIRPAGTVGIGWRMFFGDAFALSLQVRDHLYQRIQVSGGQGEADADFTSNVHLSIGFSFFLPSTVKISR